MQWLCGCTKIGKFRDLPVENCWVEYIRLGSDKMAERRGSDKPAIDTNADIMVATVWPA